MVCILDYAAFVWIPTLSGTSKNYSVYKDKLLAMWCLNTTDIAVLETRYLYWDGKAWNSIEISRPYVYSTNYSVV